MAMFLGEGLLRTLSPLKHITGVAKIPTSPKRRARGAVSVLEPGASSGRGPLVLVGGCWGAGKRVSRARSH